MGSKQTTETTNRAEEDTMGVKFTNKGNGIYTATYCGHSITIERVDETTWRPYIDDGEAEYDTYESLDEAKDMALAEVEAIVDAE